MITIIVVGHGKFPTGMLAALKLIAGEQAQVQVVDFLESDSTEILHQKIKEKIDQASNGVLILADLLGGSPFKEAVLLKDEIKDRKIEVLSGVNFPMVLTAVLADSNDVSALADDLVSEGKNSIRKFAKRAAQIKEITDDGI